MTFKMDEQTARLTTIEWSMMDKHRFLALSFVNSVALRSVLYPLTVIKTRLQVQKHVSVYKGTYDAFLKILNREGIRGLYRGFMVNTMQVVSGAGYITTYEKVRDVLTKNGVTDTRIKGLIGGGCGSLVGQTIITPFDVVSQHLMVSTSSRRTAAENKFSFENPLSIRKEEVKKYGVVISLIRELYRKDGIKGFYRGYFASVSTFVPSSALWWMFYPIFSELLCNISPPWTSHMFIHCVAGTASGATVAVLTNPLDVVRANIQVQRLDSYSVAVRKLWQEEHLLVFYKGLTARVVQSSISSAMVSLGYELMKRLSLGEEYRDKIRW